MPFSAAGPRSGRARRARALCQHDAGWRTGTAAAPPATPGSTSLPAMSEHPVVDVTIIGAGPAGLAAAYYAGHREASCRIIESLEQLGGQVAAVYPEKHIFDIAGLPEDQRAGVRRPHGRAGRCSTAPRRCSARPSRRSSASRPTARSCGRSRPTRAAPTSRARSSSRPGHGAFEPRTLPIEGLEEWRGRGLHYFVKRKADFAGKRCVIVGGGDSALDWTINLQDTAAGPIRLVHRRDRFRGLESSQTAGAPAGRGRRRACIHTPCEVRALHGGDVPRARHDRGHRQRRDRRGRAATR